MNATSVAEAEVLTLEPRAQAQLPAPITAHALVAAPAVTPSDLLRIAMETGDKDIERLERLMQMDIRYRELQEQDRKRDAAISFEGDFAAFKGENVVIPKSKEVNRGKGGTFMQAEFDDVCSRLSPALSKHGFGFRHKQTFGAKKELVDGAEVSTPWVWVTCILSHRSGHVDMLELDGPADTQTANTPIQNAQSSASILKRQSLLAITGTATGGEDDETKMRGQGAHKGSDSAKFDQHLSAGREAAMEGTKVLTAWWSAQTGDVRELLMGEFKSLKDAAKRADQGGRG